MSVTLDELLPLLPIVGLVGIAIVAGFLLARADDARVRRPRW